MQFQVPQFIEVEDKIFGPLTFKQFIYVGGAIGGAYVLYRILPFILAAPAAIGAVGLGLALAFYQYNGRPFILSLEHGFYFFMHPKLYLWSNNRKVAKGAAMKAVENGRGAEVYVPKLSESKLHDLAWSLDIQEKISAGVADEKERDTARLSSIHVAKQDLIR